MVTYFSPSTMLNTDLLLFMVKKITWLVDALVSFMREHVKLQVVLPLIGVKLEYQLVN